VNALVVALIVYAAILAVWTLVALVRQAWGKGFSIPALTSYARIVYSGPTEPRDPAVSNELEKLGFRPAFSFRDETHPGSEIFQTWVDEPGTTECLLASAVRGNYETRNLAFWSIRADGSMDTTVGEANLRILEDIPSQRTTFVAGAIEPREILAVHRARLGGEASSLRPIASEDLSIRSARTREYLEFQRSRGLLRFDPAQAKYFATRRFALRSVRQQLLPVAGDLRAKPLLIGLALACLVLVARALLPAGPVFFGAVVLAVVAADGFLAGWMFAPRVLPWSMILAAVPLYFAPAAANWAVPLLPPYVAFVTHMQRLKRKAVVVKIASPPKRLGNTILRWILLLALFVAFFLYFRHPAR